MTGVQTCALPISAPTAATTYARISNINWGGTPINAVPDLYNPGDADSIPSVDISPWSRTQNTNNCYHVYDYNDGFAIEHLNGNGPPIFFRAYWLKSAGLRADRLFALRVSGDSMEPGLWDGDLVVINSAATEPKDGVAFVVNFEGEVVIKRLERDAGVWWLASDNQRYKRKRCDEHALLIGRVIYKQSERI